MFKKFMSKKRNKKRGFTLIELIIVVAIIAILAAIAVPAFGKVSQNAKENTDLANARTIYSVVTAAVAEGDLGVTDVDKAPVTNLTDHGLATIPVPKSQLNATFKYSITNGNVTVYINDTLVYPESN